MGWKRGGGEEVYVGRVIGSLRSFLGPAAGDYHRLVTRSDFTFYSYFMIDVVVDGDEKVGKREIGPE